MLRKFFAEAIGSFALVSSICGTFIASAGFPGFGSGIIGISLAAGLTKLAMSSVFGPISGGHFNPAISFAGWIAGRIGPGELAVYIVAQLVGAILGATLLYAIFTSIPQFEPAAFASTGYGEHSPGGYALYGAALAEAVATAILALAVLGSSRDDNPSVAGPIAAGLSLTAVYLWLLPITGASVNPARSTATAFFAEPWALEQLWLFWAAPIVGAGLAGVVTRFVLPHAHEPEDDEEQDYLDHEIPVPPRAHSRDSVLQADIAG